MCWWWGTNTGRHQPCTKHLLHGFKRRRSLVCVQSWYEWNVQLVTLDRWAECKSTNVLPSGRFISPTVTYSPVWGLLHKNHKIGTAKRFLENTMSNRFACLPFFQKHNSNLRSLSILSLCAGTVKRTVHKYYTPTLTVFILWFIL